MINNKMINSKNKMKKIDISNLRKDIVKSIKSNYCKINPKNV